MWQLHDAEQHLATSVSDHCAAICSACISPPRIPFMNYVAHLHSFVSPQCDCFVDLLLLLLLLLLQLFTPVWVLGRDADAHLGGRKRVARADAFVVPGPGFYINSQGGV